MITALFQQLSVTEDTDIFYRNSYAHEIVFVHHGKGELLSEYGDFLYRRRRLYSCNSERNYLSDEV
jgi:homogentisate 1,2-dioxygenase